MLVWATVPELLKDTKEKKSCHMRLIPPRPYFLNMSNRLKARFGIEERVVKPVECRRVPLLKVAVADFRYFVEIGTAICMKPQLGLQRGVLFSTSSLRRQTELRIDRASFWRSPLFWCVDRLLPLTRSVSPERPRWVGEPVAYWLCATCTAAFCVGPCARCDEIAQSTLRN
jgi:hypothetical protein